MFVIAFSLALAAPDCRETPTEACLTEILAAEKGFDAAVVRAALTDDAALDAAAFEAAGAGSMKEFQLRDAARIAATLGDVDQARRHVQAIDPSRPAHWQARLAVAGVSGADAVVFELRKVPSTQRFVADLRVEAIGELLRLGRPDLAHPIALKAAYHPANGTNDADTLLLRIASWYLGEGRVDDAMALRDDFDDQGRFDAVVRHVEPGSAKAAIEAAVKAPVAERPQATLALAHELALARNHADLQALSDALEPVIGRVDGRIVKEQVLAWAAHGRFDDVERGVAATPGCCAFERYDLVVQAARAGRVDVARKLYAGGPASGKGDALALGMLVLAAREP
ncbi:MAG: hypothetical protein H6737_03650 [Alphaproteobacteria bacterium]|nr:hypothetical protein [Alphaproteobacteria bacterium]